MKYILFLFLFFISSFSDGQIITTFAGNGTVGNSGNGGLATSAQLFDPQSVCVDNAGNVYIADHGNHVIRKVNSSGQITIFAGTGVLGNSGDGGPAVAAQINYPYGLCIDATGNIYFSDQGTETIRKINTSGIISTIAGKGSTGYSGDGGLAINAELSSPSEICIDATDNIYFAEFGTDVIRKVNSSGIISTVAGTAYQNSYYGDGGLATNAALSSPTGVSVDNLGNIYIADEGNCRIRKVDGNGIITTFAGGNGIGYSGDGGLANDAQLKYPYFVFADNNGNVFISDTGNGVVRVVKGNGIITTIAGNGGVGYSGDGGLAVSAQLMTPAGICIDNSGNIYISDAGSHVIRKIGNCPLIVISSQPTDTTLCNKGNAKFTVNTTSPNTYQWQVNTGTAFQNVVNNSIYSGASSNQLILTQAGLPMNGYKYRCLISSSCTNIFSSIATFNVTTPSVPLVSIAVTSDTICTGAIAQFIATSINGGTLPSYQWKKNGINVATKSAYNSNSIINGDVISCLLTSNSNCIISNNALSNWITMKVNPILTPSISITSSLNNICSATEVTFKAIATNGGLKPIYQWKKNGVNTGVDSSGYSDNSLKNGDVIECMLNSNYSCLTNAVATSNIIVTNVTSLLSPSVVITTNSKSICKGVSASFNAFVINGGSNPIYQWMKNGLTTGTNNDTYIDKNLVNGDVINCNVTSNARCVAPLSIMSNDIKVTILNNPLVNLNKANTLCSGDTRVLDAGNYTSYLWNDGSTGRTLQVLTTGTYYVSVIDINGCKGSDTTTINSILPVPSGFLPADTSICSYGSITLTAKSGYKNYLWNDFSTASSITIDKPGSYWLQVTDNNECFGKDTIDVLLKDCLKGFYIPTAFTPNNDGKNDVFKPLLFGNIKSFSFIVYNRFGQTVYKSNNVSQGWDGTFKGLKLDADVFVWICNYQLEGEAPVIKKGSVMVIK